jgi:hypothetical protein
VTIRIAVECKYAASSIDTGEARNFHDELMPLNITKGLFISTAGFTAEVVAHAKSLGARARQIFNNPSDRNIENILEKHHFYSLLGLV